MTYEKNCTIRVMVIEELQRCLTSGNYKDGKEDGKSTIWYENGLKWIDKNYKDGKKET